MMLSSTYGPSPAHAPPDAPCRDGARAVAGTFSAGDCHRQRYRVKAGGEGKGEKEEKVKSFPQWTKGKIFVGSFRRAGTLAAAPDGYLAHTRARSWTRVLSLRPLFSFALSCVDSATTKN